MKKKGSDEENGRKKREKFQKSDNNLSKKLCYYVIIVGTAILIILFLSLGIVGAIGLGFANSIKSNLLIHRYCIIMTRSQVFDSPPGDPDGYGNGFLEFDLDNSIMNYDFLLANLGTIISIQIHGPVTGSDSLTAPIYIPSSGSLSTTLINNRITGSLNLIDLQGNTIVNNPTNFYILINTQQFVGGAIGARLGMECNTYRS